MQSKFYIKEQIKNQNARSSIQRNVMNFEDGGRGTKLLKVYLTLHVQIFFFLFFFQNNILGGTAFSTEFGHLDATSFFAKMLKVMWVLNETLQR